MRVVVAWRRNKASLYRPAAWGAWHAAVESGLEVARVLLLEGTAHADFDRHSAQIRSNAIEAGIEGGREWLEAADDTREVVLVLGREALDGGNYLRPYNEKLAEGRRTVGKR